MPLATPPFLARPNLWDAVALPIVLGALALLAYGASGMSGPYRPGEAQALTLDPAALPYYLLRTSLRMLVALALALLFTLVYATCAAKSRAAERILVPVLDVLQSIPILGFLTVTVTEFMALFPGDLLGVECAAIFAIFTSQAWNMTFSLYQSLRTVPGDLREAADMFQLSAWQRFWRLELPFAAPPLVWNMMMSVSGGWFFVVAAEAITVGGETVKLPGIGSYIALAIERRDLGAIGWAIVTMLAAILVYDQLVFRPLVAWADKFRFEQSPGDDAPSSWMLTLWQRTRWLAALSALPMRLLGATMAPLRRRRDGVSGAGASRAARPWLDHAWNVALLLAGLAGLAEVVRFVHAEIALAEALRVVGLGCVTALRVVLLIALASLIWVPVGVWIGLRPRIAERTQALAQFLAAFPANLVFPVAVVLILRFDLSVEIWVSPLMIIGTQWYILFNVIAAASTLPNDLRAAADNLQLSGWLRWRRLILPAIFPSYVTGALTASGGAWNASIVSELVSWGDTTLTATGLGAYIARASTDGDISRVVLGVAVMCLFVMAFNRLLWRRLYALAEERLNLG